MEPEQITLRSGRNVFIRDATINDIEAIEAHYNTVRERSSSRLGVPSLRPFNKENLVNSIEKSELKENKKHQVVIATDEQGQVIGLGWAFHLTEEKETKFDKLAVDANYVNDRLLAHITIPILKKADEVGSSAVDIESVAKEKGPQRLYKLIGSKEVGRYEEDGVEVIQFRVDTKLALDRAEIFADPSQSRSESFKKFRREDEQGHQNMLS